MIVSWDTELQAEPALRAVAEEYDAFPTPDVLITGAMPTRRHPEREAVAAYLAFGGWTSGSFAGPSPMSPLTADSIERDAAPVRMRCRDVVYAPTGLPRGRRTLDLSFGLPPAGLDEPTLAVVPGTQGRGALQIGKNLIVSSNAFAIDAVLAAGTRGIRARLAVGVLFAEDMDAAAFRVDEGLLGGQELTALRQLLRTVNLELNPR